MSGAKKVFHPAKKARITASKIAGEKTALSFSAKEPGFEELFKSPKISNTKNISQRSDHRVINWEIEILDHRIFYSYFFNHQEWRHLSYFIGRSPTVHLRSFSMPQNLTPRHCGRYPTDAKDETSSVSTQISPLDTSTQLGPRWTRQREVPKPESEECKVSLEELNPLNIQ